MALELALLIPSVAVLVVARTRPGPAEIPESSFTQPAHWRVIQPRLAPVVPLRPKR